MNPRRGGVFIGRLRGIEFYLDYSWFLIAAVLTWTLATDVFPKVRGYSPGAYAAMGGGTALLFFLCILLHELGHSLVSQRCGIPVPRITLLFIGGVAEISREPDDAKSELKIAVGGPIVSILLALLFGAGWWICERAHFAVAALACSILATTNTTLVIFNMVPGYPLDGGRILRALLWARSGKLRRATFITSRIGIGFSWVLVVVGLYTLFVAHAWGGASLLLAAMFLTNAADTGYQHALQKEVLGGVTVRDVMTPAPVCIPADLPLNLAVDEFFLTNHHVAFPVIGSDGEFRGMLRLEFLKNVPRERWPYLSAGAVAAEQETVGLKIDVTVSAARAMRLLLAAETGRLAVTEAHRIIGIITRRDILHFIKIHTELEA